MWAARLDAKWILHVAKFRYGARAPMYRPIQCTSPGDGQTSWNVWLASVERHRCSDEAMTRNPLKFAGVPQSRQQISAISGPKFTILWEHVGRYFCLTIFFSIVNMCLNCEDIVRQNRAMVPRWQFFGDFLGHAFPASCVQHILCMHSKFAPCVEAWQISNLRPLRLGEEKEKRIEEETTGQKYNGLPYSLGRP